MDSGLDQTFVALGDPARLGVVRLLRRKPLRSSEIAAALSISRPAMSRHLRVLREAGVVEETGLPDDGRARTYRLRPEPFSALRAWLDEVEAMWADTLASFKAHVEKKHPERRR